MSSLVVSFIAFVLATYFIKRYLDSIDAPRGMTRTILIFLAAAMVSYGVAFLVDWLAG